MQLNDYQQGAARTRNPALSDRDRLLDAASGLAEESGEVLGLVRKHLMQGKPLERPRLVHELGDVLWCLAAVANDAGITLAEVADANLAKLRERHPAGFTRSS
ncbi:MAG: nucleoside triphosphate pyrophosphohydrolase family protein [Gemmatimonadetes bacterium]|nr:nucleoside triphosphate pyrophosphohydrolase family protein [Gemmatimonadota bacterium]